MLLYNSVSRLNSFWRSGWFPSSINISHRFRTAVDSDEQMVEYVANSIVYTPDSDSLLHQLAYTLEQPLSNYLIGPQCEFLLDDGTQSQLQCNQV